MFILLQDGNCNFTMENISQKKKKETVIRSLNLTCKKDKIQKFEPDLQKG
jgi:hypothetical protein